MVTTKMAFVDRGLLKPSAKIFRILGWKAYQNLPYGLSRPSLKGREDKNGMIAFWGGLGQLLGDL